MRTVTLFTNVFDRRPHYRTAASVLELIKNNTKQKKLLETIKLSEGPEKERLKKELPVICWGGKFSERKVSALIENSRLVILDFDDVNPAVKKKELMVVPFIYACWVSPSGDGVKALVRVSTDNYVGHFRALTKEVTGIDESGKDVSRACFMCYDPALYINEVADTYSKIIESVYTDAQKYEKLKKWLENKGEQFVDGNRNNFLAKLAGACNRFGLSQEFVIEFLAKEFCDSYFSVGEMTTVVRSMYSHTELHSTASFDEAISEKAVTEVLSGDLETRDTIYLRDVESDLLRDFENGTQTATTTYFPSIDPIFRPLPGDLNVLCGIGNHGKSEFKKQLDLVASVKEGRKHCYFTPESYPPTFWYRELIRSYIGKPIEKDSPFRMSLAEYKRGMDFVQEHFIFVYPPSLPTPDYILERFAEVVIKHGARSLTLDPWNQLLHIMSKRDDVYLAETLTQFERFAQAHQAYMTIICHPNKTDKDAQGNYKCPDIYDLTGGSVWNARATNIGVLHRPYWGVDKTDPTVEFHSKKIKRQMISGVPGATILAYDRKSGRYLDNGYNPLDD